jgi:hypothetical protein
MGTCFQFPEQYGRLETTKHQHMVFLVPDRVYFAIEARQKTLLPLDP